MMQSPKTVRFFSLVPIPNEELRDCGAPCHAMFFPEKERTVLRYWVGSWAAVCVASCLFTLSPSSFSASWQRQANAYTGSHRGSNMAPCKHE
ncbi:unnamed protein product [Ceratitis capitata]|uniref:(Mediterranean fruit fly) hypothetical protein n=1 Tax=Ceratitis capitata TaxID=7213 RepID=A0A811V7S7_CERCA|nr:unnamed protein product [Ceratitis capitata]